MFYMFKGIEENMNMMKKKKEGVCVCKESKLVSLKARVFFCSSCLWQELVYGKCGQL